MLIEQSSLTLLQVVPLWSTTLPNESQRSIKLKISHWFYWSMSLACLLHLLSKKHVNQSFVTLFTSSPRPPFNEMFVFSGESHCCNSTFNNALLHCFWQRIFKEKTHYFRYADSAFPQLYCLKFSFKSVDISKCPARKQKGMFFSETQCRPTLNLPVADIKTEFQKVLVCSPTWSSDLCPSYEVLLACYSQKQSCGPDLN